MRAISVAGCHPPTASRCRGRRLAWLFLPLAVALCGAPAASAQDASVGRLLAAQCAQCHGTDGLATGDIDSLAGDQDLLEDLLDMLEEDRAEDVMEHQARGYRVDQLRLIAEYYASLPEPGADGHEYEEEDEYEEEEH